MFSARAFFLVLTQQGDQKMVATLMQFWWLLFASFPIRVSKISMLLCKNTFELEDVGGLKCPLLLGTGVGEINHIVYCSVLLLVKLL